MAVDQLLDKFISEGGKADLRLINTELTAAAENMATVSKAAKKAFADLNNTRTLADLSKALSEVSGANQGVVGSSAKVLTVMASMNGHSKEYINNLRLMEAADKTAAQARTESAKQSTEAAKQVTEASKQQTEASKQAAAAARTAAQAATEASKAALLDARTKREQARAAIEATKEQERLAAAATKAAAAAQKQQSPWYQLNAQYKAAATSARELAAEYVLLGQRLERLNKMPVQDSFTMAAKTDVQTRMNVILKALPEATAKANALGDALKKIDASLGAHQRNVGNYTNSIAAYFQNMGRQVLMFIGHMVGVYAIINKIREAVHINSELSDSFADLKIRIKGTDGDVAKLVTTLKQLDTRTSLTGLVDIAGVIAKKGVAKEEIAGVTKAVDDLMIALGHEIGDPHEAVSSLVKLVTVYNDDKHVTADKITSIANAIQKLTTSGVATGPFLIQFAEQMGGIRGITGLTIDKVLGMGAALEELGQRASVSSTALSQVVVKLFTEQQKYADKLKVSVEDYKAMLHRDVLGTLVKVAEALKGDAGEMEHFFEGMVDMHAKGMRVTGVIGDLAANVGYARKRMDDATVAMHQNNLVTDAAAQKQHTLAAELDRLSKKFEIMASSSGFTTTIKLVIDALSILAAMVPTIITLGTLMLIGWIAQNTALVALRLQLIGYNLAIAAYRIALGLVTAAQAAYNIGMAAITGTTRAATAATLLFNTVIKASPLGWLLGIIGLVAAALVFFATKCHAAVVSLTEFQRISKLNNEVWAKAKQATAEQVGQLNMYVAVLKDATAELHTKQRALRELIALSPEYLNRLTLENAATGDGTLIINEYIEALRRKAALQAVQSLQADKMKEEAQLEEVEFKIAKTKARNPNPFYRELTEEEKKSYGPYDNDMLTGNYIEALSARIKARRKEIETELSDVNKLIADKYKSMLDIEKKAAAASPAGKRTKAEIEADIKTQEALRDTTEKGTAEHAAALKRLIALQKEYNEYMGTTTVADIKANKQLIAGIDAVYQAKRRNEAAIADQKKQEFEIEAEGAKKIWENENLTLEQRLEAYRKYEGARIMIATIENAKEMATVQDKLDSLYEKEKLYSQGKLKLTKYEYKALMYDEDTFTKEMMAKRLSLQTAIKTLMAQGAVDRRTMEGNNREARRREEKEYLTEVQTGVEDRIAAVQDSYAKEVTELINSHLNKEINEKQFRERMLKLKHDYDIKELDLQIINDGALLENENLSAEARLAIERRLNNNRKRQAEDKLNSVQKKNNPFGMDNEDFKAMEKVADGIINLNNEITKAVDARYQAEIDALEAKKKLIDENSQAEIDSINKAMLSQTEKDKRIAVVKAKGAEQDRQIQQQQNELKRKQAIADKQAAIASIIEKTAIAVISAYAELPPPFDVIMAGLVAGVGAVQLQQTMSAPLPAYAEGTSDHPGGMALIGEERKPELIMEPGKRPYIVDKPTISNLPRHTRVIPEDKMLAQLGFMTPGLMGMIAGGNMNTAGLEAVLKGQTAELKQAIGGIPIQQFSLQNGEWVRSVKKGNNTTNYLNRNFN